MVSIQSILVSNFIAQACWYLLRYVSNGIQFSKSSVGDKSSQILSAEWPSGNLLWSPHFFSISTQSDLQINKETELHEHYLKKKRSCMKKISFHILPFPESTTSPFCLTTECFFLSLSATFYTQRAEQICDTKTGTIAYTTLPLLWALWSLFSTASYACIFQDQASPWFTNV